MASVSCETVSLTEARNFHLQAQLLHRPAKSLVEIFKSVGYVQIDTISVVERAHHHVLWTRFPKYQPGQLRNLLKRRKVFEYWAHAAAYLPISDYRFSLPLKKRFYERHSPKWTAQDRKTMRQVLKRIEVEGPMRSRDFENKNKNSGNGWWDWKPAKQALERLFLTGQLEISDREGFQKVFDIPERTLPAGLDLSCPTSTEYADYLIYRAIDRFGICNYKEMAYLVNSKFKPWIKNRLLELVEEGLLTQVKIEGGGEPYWIRTNQLNRKLKTSSSIHVLSPFDSAVIQRERLRRLFAFDYQIECYVPQPKRKFGYFSLPVLRGDQFIGRMDLKAHRDLAQLKVNSSHPVKGVSKKEFTEIVSEKLQEFAEFNNCERIIW